MIITMDSAGRLVLPKAIRQEARLTPQTPLEVRYRDGHIEIEAAPRTVRLTTRGRLRVAVPIRQGEKLSSATVTETQRRLRDGNA